MAEPTASQACCQLCLLRDLTASPSAPLFFAAGMMALTALALGVFRRIEGDRAPTR
jgi:hypothetical protein